MSFFNKYNGTSNARLLRMERVIWILIYGGLLTLVLAWFTENTQATSATGLYAVGGVALVIGLAVFYLRSLHKEE
jgi:Flp pilus assembly protein protease CpaA